MRPVFRYMLLLSLVAVLVGSVFAAYSYFNRQITLRVAVSSLEGEDAALVTALNRWFAANSRRYRLRLVLMPDLKEAYQAVIDRKADFVSMRADQAPPAQLASAFVLYKEAAFIVAVPQTGVTTLAQLNGKTIGVIAKTALDDPLLKAILRIQGIGDAKLVPLAVNAIQGEVQKRSIQAIVHISPLNGALTSELRSMRPLRNMRGDPKLLGFEDAEAVAALDRYYDAFDVPAGALRASPPLPDETVSTLSVSRHLVGRRSTPSLFVGRFLDEVMDARRGILADFPLAAQIGAPATEQNAAVPVHPGSAAFFDNEQVTLYEFLTEWAYIILLLVGAIGTGLVGLAHRIWPRDGENSVSKLAVEFIVLRRDAHGVSTPDDIARLDERFVALIGQMGEMFEEGGIKRADVHTILVAADMTERKMSQMHETMLKKQ